MNATPDLERRVAGWLADRATSAGSDRVLTATLGQVEVTGQDRFITQRLLGDELGRSQQLRLVLLAAMLAIATVGAALLVAGALRREAPTPQGGFGTLAFVRDGDLYLASADGTGAALAAHVDGSALSSPIWSPDGRWVAVQTPEPAILLFDTATMELRRLTGGSLSALASDLGRWRVGGWSPDGRELVFRTPSGGIGFASVPDGSVRPLPGWPERSDLFPGPVAWSPDGRWIVTISPNATGFQPATLVRVDPVSGVAEPLVPPSEFWDYWPSWSPDSDRVAYSRNTRQTDGVWVAALDGSEPRQILPSGDGWIWPMWSPDGAWIALKSLDRSVRPDELVVVRPDGTDPRRLAGRVDTIVGWSADGSEIGYTTLTGDSETAPSGLAGETELHVVALEDGSDRVLPVPADGAEFTWASPVLGDGGAARPTTLPSPVATTQSETQIVEPLAGDALRPDASWNGLAYRVQVGESDCAVAILRFPDQVTVLPPPAAASPSPAQPAATPAAGETTGPQPAAYCEPRFAPDGSAVMRALQPAWTFEVVRRDGTRLSGPIHFTETPTWSPAGGWLAVRCESDVCDGRDFIVRPDGSERRDLPGRPSWSSDDSVIAVETADGSLLVGNGDGTNLRAIGEFPMPAGWSPDGSTFVFVRDGDAWLALSDGSEMRNLTRFDLGGAIGAWWSPDGRWIAVLQGSTMWAHSPDGSVQQRIGTGLGPDDGRWGPSWAPAWSPDSAWVAIEHGNQVTAVRAGDWHAIRISDAWQPAWSHDSRLLAVVSDDGNGGYAVDVMNADGSGRTTVATDVAYPPLTWIR